MKTITAADEVKRLADEHGGEITPEIVLEHARPKSSVLHQLFEWDDAKASEQYRLVQAAKIIRSIKVTISGEGGKHVRVRAFHNISPADELERVYVGVYKVMGVQSYRDQMMDQCKRDIATFRLKYAALSEAAKVLEAMNEFAA